MVENPVSLPIFRPIPMHRFKIQLSSFNISTRSTQKGVISYYFWRTKQKNIRRQTACNSQNLPKSDTTCVTNT